MYEKLATLIEIDIKKQKLTPHKQILVLNLGGPWETEKIGKALNLRGVSYYVPKMPKVNQCEADWKEKKDKQFWHEGAVTLSNIVDAKGNEANMVYIVGIEKIADHEADIEKRNSLFVALTRTKCWAHLMGVHLPKSFMKEIHTAIECNGVFEFEFRRPVHIVDDND